MVVKGVGVQEPCMKNVFVLWELQDETLFFLQIKMVQTPFFSSIIFIKSHFVIYIHSLYPSYKLSSNIHIAGLLIIS